MAAAFLVLLALAQGLPIQDSPIGTAPRLPATVTAPIAPGLVRPDTQPPADDYGYVTWCYGALETYLDLYDRVMPEVTRIERAFPSPRGAENDLRVYPAIRDQARKDLMAYRAAIIATEKASPKPISDYGARALRSGQALWSGADKVKPAELARNWMGWALPGKCEQTAKTLTVKSNVLGQALIFNAGPVPQATSALPTAPSAVSTAVDPARAVIKDKPPPAQKPATVVSAAPKPTEGPTGPAPVLPKGAYVMDPDGSKGCHGRLDASIRAGRIVMICIP